MDEINNFQQEPDETLYQAWERFKELLMRCPQHYLTDMQEVILFYKGLEVPTRQILDSKGVIPTMTAVDAKERRQSMEESLSKFMTESAKRHEENSNLIKEIRASTDAAIRNQGASIKTLEIQIGQMSKVLQERGFGSLPGSTEINPRDHVKSILTTIDAGLNLICRIGLRRYAVSDLHDSKLIFVLSQTTITFPIHLYDYHCDEEEGSYRLKDLDDYSIGTTLRNDALPQKEKDPGSFTLPCYINNVCFEKALADLGTSFSFMPFLTYTNLGLSELAHTKLTVELADRTMKHPNGIAENTLVEILFRNSDPPIRMCIGTLMATKPLDADLSGTLVDQTKYHSMVGALMYLTRSRPDIVHATCYCARYQARSTENHLKEVKRIFQYLKNIINMGLWYLKDTSFELTTFSDSDHAGCLNLRKSTSGSIQFLGGDKLVSWSSKKQDCTSMSTAETEYVSLSACCAQVLSIRTQLTDYGFHFDKIPMYCDSQAAIAISCNPVQHSRTKHIDVRYHFIKEQVEKGIVELFFVRTEYQLADLFTKALPEDRFKYLVRRLGMRCLTPAELEVLANESA
ncbi:hypothetical protein Tco_0647629 [Tanacetum coccineum]